LLATRERNVVARSVRVPLLAVLALALAAVGTLSTLEKPSNAVLSASSLSLSKGAESTALYCTGLSGTKGDALGHVTFLNTTGSTRTINVEIVSDTAKRSTTSLKLAPHASGSVDPQSLVAGSDFAVAAQVNGSGVVGEEVAQDATAESPCTYAGVTNWFAAGFDSTVGSLAQLSIYNPTATAAVFNVSTYTPHGFNAPAPFRGMAVGAHSLVEINLGSQVVNTSNIGVHVKVLRGSIAIVGVQRSGSVTSFNDGVTSTSTKAWYPRVTTAATATAQIRITNTGSLPANVTVDVGLKDYHVAPQTQTIAPYSSGAVVITPNSAIPVAGYATVRLTSNVAVFTSLATGTSAGFALSSPVTPSTDFLIADFSGRGFDAATVTNTSSKTLTVHFTTIVAEGQQSASGSAQLGGGSTQEILALFSGVRTLKGATLLVTSSKPSLVVTTTLATTPVGTTIVVPLDGR
jgi:hypothetical protein